jgi:tRNA(Arg) A34 adenosine deaminase TadA
MTTQDILTQIAIDLAPTGNAKIASALVYGNQIEALGVNRKKSHPIQKFFQPNKERIYLHAEVDCIVNFLKQFQMGSYRTQKGEFWEHALHVVRVKRDEHGCYWLANAKPCPGCQRAAGFFGIREVWYSTDDGMVKL